jgi:hypothetical protein
MKVISREVHLLMVSHRENSEPFVPKAARVVSKSPDSTLMYF